MLTADNEVVIICTSRREKKMFQKIITKLFSRFIEDGRKRGYVEGLLDCKKLYSKTWSDDFLKEVDLKIHATIFGSK